MSKTTVSTAVDDIKSLIDYSVTDTTLDNLVIKAINLGLNRASQYFIDEGMYDEVGASDSFSTVANQEYVNIATETIDLDQPIVLTERTNDSYIDLVSYREYKEMFPDPTANSSSTPDVFAIFGNRLYLGPTPSGVITLYLDYVKLVTKVTSADSLPFENKYDEFIYAVAIEYMVKWLDRSDRAAILTAKEDVELAKHDLIVGASKNLGLNRQQQSRRSYIPYFSPKKVI